MRNYDPDFLNALEALDAPERPLTADEQQRLADAVLSRAVPERSEPLRVVRGGRSRRTALRTLAAAAAVVCACTVTAAAVGPALLKMISGNIGFFSAAPAATAETADPLDAPRGSYEGSAAALTAYNAPVGQSATDAGLTVTLDNISMDAAALDAFFTIQGENFLDDSLDAQSFYPLSDQLWAIVPDFSDCTVNGEEIAVSHPSQREYYRVDDNTLKLWVHYVLEEMPAGESVVVSLAEDSMFGLTGSWSFSVSLDGAALRAGAYQATPGEYEVDGGVLLLDHLAFGQLGGSIAVRQEYTYTDETWQEQISARGLSAGDFAITDNTGRSLYLSTIADPNRSRADGAQRTWLECCQLTSPAQGADSLTLTPVVADSSAAQEQRTVTAEEMRAGVQIPFSDLGGFTVQDFTVEDRAISYTLVPYGYVGHWSTGYLADMLTPNDDGVSTVQEEIEGFNEDGAGTIARTGLLTTYTDPATGAVTIRYDYYAATRAELEQIDTFTYTYTQGLSLDEAHAITLPLEPVV